MQNNFLKDILQNVNQQQQYGNFVSNMQQQANANALNNKMAELALQNAAAEQAKQNRLANAIDQFKMGYNENRNNAYDPQNLNQNQFTVTTPADQEKLANYQQQLLATGMSGNDKIANWDNLTPEAKQNIVNAVAEGKNSGYVPIDNWIKTNQDAFNPTVQTYNKTPMGKIGEIMGTVSRFADTPAGQALIYAGISSLINNDWREGVKSGLKAAQDRASSKMYQKALASEGIQTGDTGFFGNLSSTDYNSFMNRADKNRDWDYKVKKYNADEAYREKELDRKEKEYQERIRHNKVMENKTRNPRNPYKEPKIQGLDPAVVEQLQSRGYKIVDGKWTKA